MARPTRGGSTRKTAPAKKKKKTKKDRITASDDSDLDDDDKPAKPKRKTGFHVRLGLDVNAHFANSCRNRSIFLQHFRICSMEKLR
jgi:hypothetical protein